MTKCLKNCQKNPTYGLVDGKPIYCKSHAVEAGPEYKDVSHKQCLEAGCSKRPWSSRPDKKKTDFCRLHCEDGICLETLEKMMAKLVAKFEPTRYRYCRNIDCGNVGKLKRAVYGIEPKKPLFCKLHYDPEIHKDVTHGMCSVEGCLTRAGYGISGERPLYCAPCGKERGFYDIVKKKCATKGCNIGASYAPKGASPMYCSGCADHTKMENVVSPQCLEPNCKKRTLYGFKSDMKATYCAEHADKLTMIAFNSSTCKFEGGCTTQPTFGEQGGPSTHCGKHRNEEMVDVKHHQCKECITQPIFGLEGGQPTHCADHRDKTIMVDVKHNRCQFEHCIKRPTFGYEKKKAIYCDRHAIGKGMKDVMNPRCDECNITTVNRHYKPHCSSCFYNLNPESERTINFKIKELAFTQPLAAIHDGMILDKVIAGGSSKFRPDALLDVKTHCIIVEIDEGQHSNYDSNVEDYRLQTLRSDLGCRPLTVIRLNPDSYKNGESKRVAGCFQRKRDTNTLVRKEKELQRRLEILMIEVEKAKATPSTEEIRVISLFFDAE